MDKLWKGVMHLNAQAFCLAAFLFFLAVAGWCGWCVSHPRPPLHDGGTGRMPELAPAWTLGALDFVSNQVAADAFVIPVDPFRPTIEAILTNETQRTAFLKALKDASGNAKKPDKKAEDPFAHLRKKEENVPDGQSMIVPKLTFAGFIERPDGQRAALFHDSSDNSAVFCDPGQSVHGVKVLNASMGEAEILFADGTSRTLPIGETVELAAEPAKTPPAGPAAKPRRPGAQPGARPKAKANG